MAIDNNKYTFLLLDENEKLILQKQFESVLEAIIFGENHIKLLGNKYFYRIFDNTTNIFDSKTLEITIINKGESNGNKN
jgi:hypothetical protein